MKAIVVFHGHGTHPLSGLLKRGFKHCFAALLCNGYWVVVDGCEGVAQVSVVATEGYDLAGFYRADGHTVVEMERPGQSVRVPFIAASCVGLVKAALGLRAWALTPWQLHLHLTRFTR